MKKKPAAKKTTAKKAKAKKANKPKAKPPVAAKKPKAKKPSPKTAAPKKKTGAAKKITVPAVQEEHKPDHSAISGKYTKREEELKRVLIIKRDELLKETRAEISKHMSGDIRKEIESALDEGDWSVIDLSEDINLRRLGTNRDTLMKIESALVKLKEHTYGVCDDCGEEISAERLKVLPFATRCRDCQEDREEEAAAKAEEEILYRM